MCPLILYLVAQTRTHRLLTRFRPRSRLSPENSDQSAYRMPAACKNAPGLFNSGLFNNCSMHVQQFCSMHVQQFCSTILSGSFNFNG
jgi:hypothetical protein